MTKTQIATIILFLGYFVWEYYVQQWAQDEVGAIIRVDLILIYPLLLVMLIISIIQLIRRNM